MLNSKKKSILIHIGPPKTGTSAVQNWCSSNVSLLRENGVFYPSHHLDPNGISSGNLLAIYDRNDSLELNLNQEKTANLLLEFNASDCTTLFLSSEFFFKKLSEVLSVLPDAKILVYLRNPVEKIESGYNQSIKRHGQKNIAAVPRFQNKIPEYEHLLDMVSKHGTDRFIFRCYGQNYYIGSNIISDVISVLRVSLASSLIDIGKINGSYQYEALEFKRWLNNFSLGQLQHPIDHSLQKYAGGTESFSFIPEDDFKKARESASALVENYCARLPVDKSLAKEFVSSIKTTTQGKYCDQKLDVDKFIEISNYLRLELGDRYIELYEIIRCSDFSEYPEYTDAFLACLYQKPKPLSWFDQLGRLIFR